MLTETIHTQLAQVVSREAVSADAPTVDGERPAFAVTPRSVEELAAAVAELAAAATPTILVGGGTMLELGMPPSAADAALRTTGLNAITEYQPADLILTAEAGVTLAVLQQALREHGQMLPLEVPRPQQATVGGALAANAYGPLRYAFGTGKDLVMGMQFIQGDGTRVKSGGEVVKNVAGFGLHKLQVGALGTLGVIATVTFKVFPAPKADETVVFACADASAAFDLAYAVRAHHPAAAVILNEPAQARVLGETRGSHVLLARFMGAQRAVARQVRAASAAAAGAGAAAGETDLAAGGALWQKCVDLGWEAAAPPVLFKASAVPSELRHVYADLMRSAETSDGTVGVVADPLSGSLRCGVWPPAEHERALDARQSPLAQLVPLLQRARTISQEHGGSLEVQRGSVSLKTAVDVWGPHPQGLAVMRNLKRTYDPGHILNPGRFVGDM